MGEDESGCVCVDVGRRDGDGVRTTTWLELFPMGFESSEGGMSAYEEQCPQV